ncbi:MAG: hypothetical protein E7255_00385 [Lachnospiraceae bacterium]|nr:hypothetical protein [Lachnospiraceae bacterium]
MQTLIIYDATGYIISQMSGDVREPVGIPFLWIEIPEGKRVVSVDPETGTPVYEDLPVPEIQQLKDQIDALNIAMAQMLGM